MARSGGDGVIVVVAVIIDALTWTWWWLWLSTGLVGPASLLLAAAYLPGCGRVGVVTLLTLAMGFSGFTVAGHSVNHLDIAPAFAGQFRGGGGGGGWGGVRGSGR